MTENTKDETIKQLKELLLQISKVIEKDEMLKKIKKCVECGGRMLVSEFSVDQNKDTWSCYDCGYTDSSYSGVKKETKDETIKNLEEQIRQKSDLIENMEKENAHLKKMVELGITEEDLFTDIKYPTEV